MSLGKNALRRGVWEYMLGSMDLASGLGDSAWLLYGLTRSLKPKVCVEIGSAKGKSACHIGMALRDNGFGKLYAIDPHCATDWNDTDAVNTFDLIRQNLSSLRIQEYVEIVRERSDVAARSWKLTIDLLFIDGDHSYEGVKRDWDLFSPFVREFGCVLFHDTLWDRRPDPKLSRADMGVPRFVEGLRQEGFPVLTIDRDFGVSIVQPVKGGNSLSNSERHK